MRDIYCIHGAEPEVLAYGMAKYSRSASPLRETLKEISSQKAASFLETFYFSYGHKSIADMAHVPMALEGISLLAAIEVVDEQRWDGQERSTRYQDFSKRLHYRPEVEGTPDWLAVYDNAIASLFDGYDALYAETLGHLVETYPCPEGKEGAAHLRTLKARAFDVARYLLPLATLTSVGQVTSARTLEDQVSRLAGSNSAEVREIAEEMRCAATRPAYNLLTGEDDGPATSPTLVKYSEPKPWGASMFRKLVRFVSKVDEYRTLFSRQVGPVSLVEFLSLEEEVAATLLYSQMGFNEPMGQILACLRSGDVVATDVIAAAMEDRGAYDEFLRQFRSGSGITFDIKMDIGGYRDMHRHRRCIQVVQEYSNESYAQPDIPSERGREIYNATVKANEALFDDIMNTGWPQDTDLPPYILPLGANIRFLMKMDFAELAYITELRTKPAGHISYREVAFAMYEAFAWKHTELAKYIRVTPITDADVLKR